jgi:aryl carrier-like protein
MKLEEGIPIDLMEVLKKMGGVEIEVKEEEKEEEQEELSRGEFMIALCKQIAEVAGSISDIESRQRNLNETYIELEHEKQELTGQGLGFVNMIRQVEMLEDNGYRLDFYTTDSGVLGFNAKEKEQMGFVHGTGKV